MRGGDAFDVSEFWSAAVLVGVGAGFLLMPGAAGLPATLAAAGAGLLVAAGLLRCAGAVRRLLQALRRPGAQVSAK